VVDAIDEFILAMDQPTVDGMNTYFVCEAARQTGLKVAISGLGGDEVFGGYPSFDAVPLLASGLNLARAVPGHRWIAAQARMFTSGNRFGRLTDAVTASLPSWLAAYVAVRGIFSESSVARYLRGVAAAELKAADRDSLGEYGESWKSAATSFDRVSAFELRGYMANQLLRDTDVFSMAHSIELRVPLLDHRLVEYVASLPEPFKGRTGKRLLRLAVQNRLPAEILSRPKQGFAFPWKPWLMGRLGDQLMARMRAVYPLVEDVLCVDQIEALWQRFRKESAPWAQVWSIAMLVLWTARLRSNGAVSVDVPGTARLVVRA
jgi:asparagine synthase (glutamine-hydrolysing)